MNLTPGTWLNKLRSHHSAKFTANDGYALLDKHEDWRYTNLKEEHHKILKLEKPMIGFVDILDIVAQSEFKNIKSCLKSLKKKMKLLDDLKSKLDQKIYIQYIADEIKNNSKIFKDYLDITFNQETSKPLILENTANFQDGILIQVPVGVNLTVPICSFFSALSEKGIHSSYLRNIIILEENSSLTWVEDYISDVESRYFNQIMNEIIIKPNARLNHIKLQREGKKALHLCTNQILQYKNSYYSSDVFTVGASLSRNEIHIKMLDEGCESRLHGIYTGDDDQHSDHHIQVEHMKPNSTSHQVYRGTLKGKATSVFRGNIYVHPKAQQTCADQSSKTLLLSGEAEMNAKPQLKIFADDVKCSHGITIGQLEENILFYMKSRGISHENANKMLQKSFLSEALEAYPNEILKKYLLNELEIRI